MSKPYPLPLKHHTLVKEGIKNLLEVELIERLMSPNAAPIIEVPRKSKPEAPPAETKRQVIDYPELKFDLDTTISLYTQIQGPKLHSLVLMENSNETG